MMAEDRGRNEAEALRREIEKTITQRKPTGVKQQIRTASVQLNIEPSCLPRESCDLSQLEQMLKSEFRVTFDDSEIRNLLPPEALNAPIPAARLMEIAVQNDKVLRFADGILRLPNIDRITNIQEIAVGEQMLAAVVHGTSDEAMFLCKRLCLALWEACGFQRKWEEFEKDVGLAGYNTVSWVDFGFPLRKLLSGGFRTFLKEDIEGGDLGKQMGPRYFREEDRRVAEPDLRVISYCHRIQVNVSVQDTRSGDQDDVEISIMLDTRRAANRSTANVRSPLKSDIHERFVDALAVRIRQETE